MLTVYGKVVQILPAVSSNRTSSSNCSRHRSSSTPRAVTVIYNLEKLIEVVLVCCLSNRLVITRLNLQKYNLILPRNAGLVKIKYISWGGWVGGERGQEFISDICNSPR